MNHNFKDLTGQHYGYLTVLSLDQNPNNKRIKWLCKCKCGNTKIIAACDLIRGHTSSCGCKKFESHNKKHGLKHTRLYDIWSTMKARCHREGSTTYSHYGARGITVCDEWRNDFMSFYNWAMSNGYSDDLTIDRKDTNKNYCPENCRWATMVEQSNNRNTTIRIKYLGVEKPLADWCRELNLDHKHIYGIYKRRVVNNPNLTLEEINKYDQEQKEKKANNNKPKRPPIKKRRQKLAQYSLDGQLVMIWNTTVEAEQVAGFNAKAIRNCCCGLSSSSGGYYWKFINP